jgi:hypothetical protein
LKFKNELWRSISGSKFDGSGEETESSVNDRETDRKVERKWERETERKGGREREREREERERSAARLVVTLVRLASANKSVKKGQDGKTDKERAALDMNQS